MKVAYYKGTEVRIFENTFELWRNDVLIAEFIYNKKKNLNKQILEALEM